MNESQGIPLTLNPGERLGPYEIVALIDAGGMGEVYKARDTRLNRTVAIKTLPSHDRDDSDRRRRFEREARAIAALAHPHICVLHDIGRYEDIDFLVMEYLEGETLSRRLLRGPLPIEQVLQCAIEIGDALDKAHRQGIIHRDLKPGNIMLTKSGIKLLDFGLAKLPPPVVAGAMKAPAATDSLTADGRILGTLAYMAPEQLDGRDADARTDIFAFGSIIREMATGQRAFDAEGPAKLIGAILKDTPAPISTMQPSTPPLLDQVVARCLAKDPDDRWQSARDLTRDLKWVQENAAQTRLAHRTDTRGHRQQGPIGWAVAIIGVVVAAVFIASVFARRAIVPSPATRFSVPAPEHTTFLWSMGSQVAVSPDGRALAFTAAKRDESQTLWVRPLDSTEARQLPRIVNAWAPFWSADSRFIMFGSWPGKLKRIPLSGGPAQTISDAPGYLSGTSNRDGTIIFAGLDGLYRVSASGGRPVRITTLDDAEQETGHGYPQFLPDGRRFLYVITSGRREHAGIYCGSLASAEKQRVLADVSRAAYSEAGYLLFMRGKQLLAQRFEERSLEITGDPVPIAERVGFLPGIGYAAFSISETAVLAYAQAGSNPNIAQLVWVDRTGKELNTVGAPGAYSEHALSPDERQVAVTRRDPDTGTTDIWLLEIGRGTMSRLTVDPSNDWVPLWSPDGARVFFASNRTGRFDLYQKAANGESTDQLLLRSTSVKSHGLTPEAWSPDGRALIYNSLSPNQSGELSRDVWMLPLSPDTKPSPLIQTEFDEWLSQVSPDGRWMAYVSTDAGEPAVYVRPFGSSAMKRRISTGRGSFPRWRGDGRELFYLVDEVEGVDRVTLMAVAVGGEATFEAGVPKRLFEWRRGYSEQQAYAVSRDGRRFLINKHVGEPPVTPITVVLSWTEALKK